jgi:hypothetical protein
VKNIIKENGVTINRYRPRIEGGFARIEKSRKIVTYTGRLEQKKMLCLYLEKVMMLNYLIRLKRKSIKYSNGALNIVMMTKAILSVIIIRKKIQKTLFLPFMKKTGSMVSQHIQIFI